MSNVFTNSLLAPKLGEFRSKTCFLIKSILVPHVENITQRTLKTVYAPGLNHIRLVNHCTILFFQKKNANRN